MWILFFLECVRTWPKLGWHGWQKKRKGIWVYQNDLLKKIKLEKRVMACSYGIMEFGTLHRNLLLIDNRRVCALLWKDFVINIPLLHETLHFLLYWSEKAVQDSNLQVQDFHLNPFALFSEGDSLWLLKNKPHPVSFSLNKSSLSFWTLKLLPSQRMVKNGWCFWRTLCLKYVVGNPYFWSDSGHYCNRNILTAIMYRL